MGYERAPALQHQGQFVLGGKAARKMDAVRLDCGDGQAGEPRHLARMRRQHHRPPFC